MKKLMGRVALPLLGLSILAGCAPTGGTAAIVNDVTIPDSRVTQFAKGCAVALQNVGQPATANQLRTQMVGLAVLDEMSRQYVADAGVGPTDDQLRSEIRRLDRDFLLSDPRCEQATLGLMRYNVIAISLGQDWADTFGKYQVELNPRYGQWDWSRLMGGGSGSLSQVARFPA